MNTPIPVSQPETDALRDDLRLSNRSPRPIPFPEKRPDSRSEGKR
jgi:hypothetical protein